MTVPLPEAPSESAAIRTRVRMCIAASGLRQREVAERIGLDPTKLSKSLNGTRRFMPDELARLAELAGTTVTWLVTGRDPEGQSRADDAATGSARTLQGAETLQKGPAGDAAGTVVDPSERGAGTQRRTPEAAVEAAWRLFGTRGFDAVGVAEIAAAAGVSVSTLHGQVGGKRELFEACLRYAAALAALRANEQLTLTDGPVDRLRTLFRLQAPVAGTETAISWSVWLQAWADVAVGLGSRVNQSRAYERWYGSIVPLLREGQRDGSVVPHVSAEDLATVLTSLYDGLGTKVMAGTLDVETLLRLMDEAIDMLVRTRG